MMTHSSGDWSVFQQIFAEHWDVFAHAHPRSQPPSYEGRVAKMLVCGNSEQMGCTAVLCLRCAKVHVDNWVSRVSQGLHAGGIYRHIIVPVPALFRTTFDHNAAVVLSAFMRCGAQCLEDCFSMVRGKTLQGGYIMVLHTHGRNGQ